MDSEYLRLSNRIKSNEDAINAQSMGSFLGLSDTPEGYGTSSGKLLKVNDTADGIAFSSVTGSGTLMPVGSMLMWTSADLPSGWLRCDGGAVSRVTYSQLFAAIGTTYGSGDGSTTFNLPNLKGRFPLGKNGSDSDFNELGETGGEKAHALSQSELASHTHSINHDHGSVTSDTSSISLGYSEDKRTMSYVPDGSQYSVVEDVNETYNHTHSVNLPNYSGSSGSSGSGSAHNNMPPFIAVDFIICWQDVKIPFKGDKGDTGDTGDTGAAGADAPYLQYQFSADSASWHPSFTSGDKYIRFSTDGGTSWGDAILFQGPQGETGDTGPQGPQGTQGVQGISIRNMGAWNSSTEYVNDSEYIDIVEHEGSGYLCRQTAANQEPPSASYWDLIVSKGETGDTGDTGDTGPAGDNAPAVLAQYSSDNSNWHPSYLTGDSYIRFSYDGGTSYGTGMLFKGTDGMGSGDVTGPVSAANNSFAAFDGTTGKAIKDSGKSADSFIGAVSSPSDERIAVFDGTGGKAIKDGGQTLAELTAAIKLAIYPVGSVYTSVDPTSPATLFGGTWAVFGEGRALVGYKSGDGDFGTAEGTCGAKTHTLTESEMPSHTHVQDSHGHTQNSHTHTINHDHGSFTSSSNGSHYHELWWGQDRPISLSGNNAGSYGVYSSSGYRTGYSSGSVYRGATNAAAAGTHTHSINPPSFSGSSGSTTAANNSTTATNQSTGGDGAHNNIQPSITVYMWKRTA